MEPMDNKLYKMHNYMEAAVLREIDVVLKESDCCDCSVCRMDIAAYALNHLPPKYVVTQRGEAYSKISELHQQFEVDVMMALMDAIKVISKNPRHPVGAPDEE